MTRISDSFFSSYTLPNKFHFFKNLIQIISNEHMIFFSLNGLVMGFGKITSNELIQADARHCINVVISVDVYIFRPPVGSILEGNY